MPAPPFPATYLGMKARMPQPAGRSPSGSVEPSPLIRPARPEESHVIADIHVRSWRAAYRGMVPDAILAALDIHEHQQHWEKAIAASGRGAAVLVAELNGPIAGFISYGKRTPEDLPKDTGEVYKLYLDPDFYGQGIGGHLLRAAVEGMKRGGYARAVLWVLVANRRARHFYEKAGWRPDGASRIDATGADLRYAITLG